MTDRHIYAGDNLAFMQDMADNTAQMVYMDPPFASGRDYNAILQASRSDGSEMVSAFSDIWSSPTKSTLGILPDLQTVLTALAPVIPPAMTNYLAMMATRIVEAKRILEPRGSLYLHCDPSASHYLKIILDIVFGAENFRNEVIWRRTHAHSSSRKFGPVHDVILFYSKSKSYVWNQPYAPYTTDYLDKYYKSSDARGRYQLITCTGPGDRAGTKAHYSWRGQLPPPGRHWAWQIERMEELDRDGLLVHSARGIPRRKRYEDESPGVVLQDVWNDIGRLDAHSSERVGYDTQKPIQLLSRLIMASTEPGGIVIDPFAGSGTTAVAAEELGRSWMVSDQSLLAASLTLSRTRSAATGEKIKLSGFPDSRQSAEKLRERDRTTYGAWGTSILGATIDRARSSAEITEGNGKLGIEMPAITRSWVPLQKSYDLTSAKRQHETTHGGYALTFDALPLAEELRTFDRYLHSPVKVINVTIEQAVSARTLTNGLASPLSLSRLV